MEDHAIPADRSRGSSSSLCNQLEAWVVTSLVQLVQKSSKKNRQPLTIGCISPYKLQVRSLCSRQGVV